jgi:hypothetical protein
MKTCVQNTTLFSSFLPLEIVSREIKTNEHKLENYRRSHIIDLLTSVAQFPSFLMR